MKNNKQTDYKNLYDGYWQRSDRIGERSGDLKKIARMVAETCGYGCAIDIGCGEGYLVAELMAMDIDAIGLDISSVVVDRANSRWNNRFVEGSILAIPFPDEKFNVVVSTDCMEHLAPEDVPAALREIFRVSSRYVFLQIATTPDRDGHWHLTIEGRTWWENRCFEAGFRKHPLYYQVNSYESLNNDGWQVFILLEKIPADALKAFDLSVLEEERMLHNDMLRVNGRRSDAHCIRYHKACEFIRPGDHVLDVACGLGYGSHILYAGSKAKSVLGVDLSEFGIEYAHSNYGKPGILEFKCGDAQALEFIPGNSIDFIAGFETIEHVPDPIAYLRELRRVLKPSGRVMVCAPNNWVDETGKDPNPHHFHVYTWRRLVAEVGAFFLLEQGFLQTAGGALKCPDGSRTWLSVSADIDSPEDSEWVLLLGMADPLGGKGIPYGETVWKLPESPEFNVAAFSRDYQNPWLVKGMVSIGMRMSSRERLVEIQERVLSTYGSDTVDYGAALCGRIYSYIDQREISIATIKGIDSEVRRYASIVSPTPHQLRWQVSLLFAAGELAQKQGRTADALFFYSECARLDVLPYSPTLGNKTLDALFYLAKDSIRKGDISAARGSLLRTIEESRRLSSNSWVNIVGEQQEPLPFGLAEMAQLLDKAARAAYVLSVLDREEFSPATVFKESMGFFERHVNYYKEWGNVFYEKSNYLFGEISKRDERIEYLLKNECSQKDEISRLHAKKTEANQEFNDLTLILNAHEKQNSELKMQLSDKDRQIAMMSLINSQAREDLCLIKQSLSWRTTAPLRSVGRVVNNVIWRYGQFFEVRTKLGLNAAIRHTFGFLLSKLHLVSPSKCKSEDYQETKIYPEKVQGISPAVLQEATTIEPALKVLMLVDAFHDGGVERVVIDLCLYFRKAGISCKILVAKDGGRSAAEARSYGIEVIELRQDQDLLRSIILDHPDAIAISHHCYFAISSFRSAGIPVIEVIHNAYHWQRENKIIVDMRKSDISHFIAVSKFVSRFSVEELNIDSSRITIINNGLNNIDLVRPPLEILRKKRLETKDTPIFLHVANLHPQKNHRLVVNSFAQIKRKYPNAQLVMAGAMTGYPEILSKLYEDIESLEITGSVTFAGPLQRRELSKLMARAHVGILPSLLEGFSIATLELSYFGLPTILSSTGAAQELHEAYGHVKISQGCALSQKRLDIKNVDEFLKSMPADAVNSVAESAIAVLDDYCAYLEKALTAASRYSDYSIEKTVADYVNFLQSIKSGARNV